MTGKQYSGRWILTAIVALILLFGACADESDDATTAGDETQESTTTTSTTVAAATSSDVTVSSSASTASTVSTATTAASSTTTAAGGATTLPGEEFVGYVTDGDVLGVVAVRHDDVLNIRALPGTGQPVVATAAPTEVDLVATGRARLLPNAIWFEVTRGTTTGWANARFLGHVARTDDVTAAFLADYGEAPEAETLLQLGELVAAEFASVDPPSVIVLTVAPTVGDLGEVTYDVIGLGDDSVLGFRLHLFATEGEGGESFVLGTIEQTMFCMRGTAGDICT